MRTIAATLLPVLALGLAVSSGAACSRRADPPEQAAPAPVAVVPEVSVDELDHLLASHRCVAVDANADTTRRRMGVIPGAVLLRDMDAVDQLPADRTTGLVFYCANRACRASHEAAEKALAAGYTHVRELPDGIAGWVQAGKQTSSI
ncbi:MAG TPA: rhodanese-like domain-containing protein [Kofleriaceae bacterium]|jgi:rhodanese-related sulfurtransferase|nr:rhodanese-like domain-containing protein [Kofleriaceae bacterium]